MTRFFDIIRGKFVFTNTDFNTGGGVYSPPIPESDVSGLVQDLSDVNQAIALKAATTYVNTQDTVTLNSAKAYSDSLIIGLVNDRGNFTPSGSYPSSGGSGTAGAIRKGDLWTISGLGSGNTALMGTQTVTDGDTVRALVNTPGNTNTNWAVSETNIGYAAENQSNKATAMSGNETSNIAYLSAKAIYDWAVSLFIQKNIAIVAATKTKIQYDINGLVISGSDATTADIPDSTGKRYQTENQKNFNDATSSIQTQLNSKVQSVNGKSGNVDLSGEMLLYASSF